MFKLIKYLCFFVIISITTTSCFYDVTEDLDVKEYNAKSIEEITENLDYTLYRSFQITNKIPILAWLGVPENYTSIERFLEMKDAGININYSNYTHADSLHIALDIAQQLDMKILIRCPELYSDTEATVKRFINHPANGGYFLYDEPFPSRFEELKLLESKIEAIDSTRFCYINLFPSVSSPDLYSPSDYTNYVRTLLNEVPVKILSFDYYPILSNGIRLSWYQNLEIIRSEAVNSGIPFWAFALTTAHNNYVIPDLSHLRLQVYSNLAYGAKGIQYFTYWTQISNKWNFHNGPIETDGSKTEVYDYLKQINEELQVYSDIFLSSKVTNVNHYGTIPQGTTKFSKKPYYVESIKINGGNALLSELQNSLNNFYMIQNTTIDKEIGITIKTDSQTKIVLKSGYIIPASYINEEFKLTPGDMVMFMR